MTRCPDSSFTLDQSTTVNIRKLVQTWFDTFSGLTSKPTLLFSLRQNYYGMSENIL